ncbi:hypothetical protein [Pseudomonas sp. W03]|uniref:hypothetical protein n=1 Tax=Pseudomonas sp. W03 TaxID=3090666 RepID=UPI003A4DFB2E
MSINVNITININVQQPQPLQPSPEELAVAAKRREETMKALQALSLRLKKSYANQLLNKGNTIAYLNYVRRHKLIME